MLVGIWVKREASPLIRCFLQQLGTFFTDLTDKSMSGATDVEDNFRGQASENVNHSTELALNFTSNVDALSWNES